MNQFNHDELTLELIHESIQERIISYFLHVGPLTINILLPYFKHNTLCEEERKTRAFNYFLQGIFHIDFRRQIRLFYT